ncbi:MAG: plasmid mobilization protein [Microcystaceae cyanobacterium]
MGGTSQTNKKEVRQIFPLRLSQEERAALEARAVEAGLKLSEYLRRAGLFQHLPQRRSLPEVNRQTYLELGRIGNNINQLTKACHTALKQGGGCNIDPTLLQSLSNQLDQIRLEVLAIDPSSEDEDDWQTD